MKVITLDKEIFDKAFSLCERQLTMEEILVILQSNDDVAKQIAILQINDLQEHNQAKLLVEHLTGHDGPIREVSAFKIKELFLEKKCGFLDNIDFYPVYAKAVCDVNPNISRFVIDFLPNLREKKYLIKILISEIEKIYERIDNPDKEQKNFLTVRLFNLYWCFEAVSKLIFQNEQFFDIKKLVVLLERALNFNDYTINEKIAKIVTCSACANLFDVVAKKMRCLDNFYIRRYFEE